MMRIHDGTRRWICWPHPDEVCIEGGCMRCTAGGGEHKIMTLVEVRNYARSVGLKLSEEDLRQGVLIRACNNEMADMAGWDELL